MGWWLTADPAIPDPASGSITVALISILGTVIVALIAAVGQILAKRGGDVTSLAAPDSHLNERVAVTEARVQDGTRTIDVLDRHVDAIDLRLENLTVRVERLEHRDD